MWFWRWPRSTACGPSSTTALPIFISTSDKGAAHVMRLLLGSATAALLFSSGVLAVPPLDLDAFVALSMKTFGPPGMSVAIVESGKPVFAKGYGVRSIATHAPANEHTAFP